MGPPCRHLSLLCKERSGLRLCDAHISLCPASSAGHGPRSAPAPAAAGNASDSLQQAVQAGFIPEELLVNTRSQKCKCQYRTWLYLSLCFQRDKKKNGPLRLAGGEELVRLGETLVGNSIKRRILMSPIAVSKEEA